MHVIYFNNISYFFQYVFNHDYNIKIITAYIYVVICTCMYSTDGYLLFEKCNFHLIGFDCGSVVKKL